MRKKLFNEIYMLLEDFAGEILNNPNPNFYFTHTDTENEYYNSYARKIDSNHMVVGTFYFREMDYITDPELTILFNTDLKIARLIGFYNDNPYASMLNGGKIHDVKFECTENSNEKDNEERALNNYLRDWLQAFSKRRKDNKNYFERLEL